jgi:hypothetical protein
MKTMIIENGFLFIKKRRGNEDGERQTGGSSEKIDPIKCFGGLTL